MEISRANALPFKHLGLIKKNVLIFSLFLIILTISKSDIILANCNNGELLIEANEFYDIYPTAPSKIHISVYCDNFKLEEINLEVINSTLKNTNISLYKKHYDIILNKINFILNININSENFHKVMDKPVEDIIVLKISSKNSYVFKEIKLRLNKAKWLLMYYLPAETDLYKYEIENLKKIIDISSKYKSHETAFLVLVDLKDDFNITTLNGTEKLNKSSAYILQIINGNVIMKKNMGNINMNNGITLKNFINFAQDLIPSNKTQLIIAGHGKGIYGLFLEQYGSKDYLSIKRLSDSLRDFRFDIITFDACLMSQLEVLFSLKNSAKYIVAAESTLPAEGINYEKMLSKILLNPDIEPFDYSKYIVKSYNHSTDYVLSVIDGSEITRVVSSLESMLNYILYYYENNSTWFYDEIFPVIKSSYKVDAEYPFIDLADFIEKIKSRTVKKELIQQASLVLEAIDSAVIISNSNKEIQLNELNSFSFNGISIFLWSGFNEKYYSYKYSNYLDHINSLGFDKASSWIFFQKKILDQNKKLEISDQNLVILFNGNKDTYIHLYDENNFHIGYNYDLKENAKIDVKIPGSLYMDYKNGTKKIILSSRNSIRIIIDNFNLNNVSEYRLTFSLFNDDKLMTTESCSKKLNKNTSHSIELQILGDQILVDSIDTRKINITPEYQKVIYNSEKNIGSEQILLIMLFIIITASKRFFS